MIVRLRSSAAPLALLSLCAFSSIAGTAPDANLFTSYSLSSTEISFLVCGSVPGSDGCYGSGTLGPFGHVGAIVSSPGKTVGDAVSRDVFVVDVAGGAAQDTVILYRYELTNTVNPPYDTVSYKLTKQVTLPLKGGTAVRCSLAANTGFLFVGTNRSTSAVEVSKDTFAITSVGGFSNDPVVSAITTDDRGFVTIAFGTAGSGGNVVFGPTGGEVQDGGGAAFAVPAMQGLSTADLPTG
jgi:hypothetical protein